MAIQSFSRCCSYSCDWSGGICDVTFSSNSFNTARSSSRDRGCEFGDNGAFVAATVFNTICWFGGRSSSVALEDTFHLPPLRGCWVDPILDLAGSPFALPTAYIGLSAFLNCTWGLPPGCPEFVYRFIRREAEDAARRASGLRHDALAIRVTVKVVSCMASDAPVPDDEEELVFWEETEAGAGEGACTVCLEEMEEGKTVVRLRCGHAFDKSCISRWLERKMQCPLCRSHVKEII
uniref:RING-type domain-containing protein n=1 Tax=Ananas comosus var. bracteatus TaxID=296719 RepID=A0A6V7QJP9_ANACO|nr:unnamed protein product [Ananas comosus var. bracteatus]